MRVYKEEIDELFHDIQLIKSQISKLYLEIDLALLCYHHAIKNKSKNSKASIKLELTKLSKEKEKYLKNLKKLEKNYKELCQHYASKGRG